MKRNWEIVRDVLYCLDLHTGLKGLTDDNRDAYNLHLDSLINEGYLLWDKKGRTDSTIELKKLI